MSRFFQRLVFVLGTAVFGALGLGFLFGQFGFFGVHAGGDQDGAYRQMSVYAQVLKRIQSDYVTEPNITDVTTGALHGLLESLDADSSYLTPAEYKIYKDRPTTGVGQIGVTVSKRGGYLAIVDVTPGSPADHEHLQSGDVIESIGDTSTFEASLAVTRMMLEGKPGTSVTLTVVKPRKADPDKVTVTRALAQVPQLSETQYENSTILYLKPGVISKARVDELGAKIKGSKAKKILLDLRDVSGGEEEDGVRLANFFIQSGTLAQLEGQKFPKQTFAADAGKFLTQAPVVVLVNRGTYGAAELVASAIEDAKRGDVVGERTFGEGSMQKTIELPDGAALLLTVAKYEGPAGKKIQDEAVTPNVRVAAADDNDDEDSPSKGDPMLDKGLELLKAKG
ncbi:S41 family peptidase [Terracidiphilus sp.]|uniref:S41 family peptidase n=1 Tax=Terracidiphilus sp. TaxID=1964191 RepID=UPI003C1C88E0